MGRVKEIYYADKPVTIEHLKVNIRDAIAEIHPMHFLHEYRSDQIRCSKTSSGNDMNEIIFNF